MQLHLLLSGGVFTGEADSRLFVLASNKYIPSAIYRGIADFALLGSDQYDEIEGMDELVFEPVADLPCKRVLAIEKTQGLVRNESLRVATSYPNALAKFLTETSIDAVFTEQMPGKVEAAIALGVADAIFDIKEKGETIEKNNLKVVAEEEKWLQLGGLWRPENNSSDTLLYNEERI